MNLRSTPDDAQLIARYRRGDQAAFELIHQRYRSRLERFAHRMLARNPQHAEDVVQEAMLRASRALLRDEREIDLKPWLFRLVRNCTLDELARVRTDAVELEDADARGALRAPVATEPAVAHERRAGMRDLLEDLAALPEEQRHALVRREVDGLSHAQVARELGLTEQATKSLVFRARGNLVREREARSEACHEVRADLLEAADAGRRAPASALRHVAHCAACRAYRRDLQLTRRAAAVMIPGPLLLAGIGGLKLGGFSLAGKGAGAKATAGAAAGLAAAGTIALGTQVFGPGDPAPQKVRSPAVAGGQLARGQALPQGTAIVRHTLDLQAATTRHPRVSLRCPEGLRVADLLDPRGARIAVTYAPGTVVGSSRTAQIVFAPAALARRSRVTVAMLCKQPAASGTILAPDARAGSEEPTHRVGVDDALLRVSPGGEARGSVRRDQPVTVVGSSPGWRQVVTDQGDRGWVPERILRRIPAGG